MGWRKKEPESLARFSEWTLHLSGVSRFLEIPFPHPLINKCAKEVRTVFFRDYTLPLMVSLLVTRAILHGLERAIFRHRFVSCPFGANLSISPCDPLKVQFSNIGIPLHVP